jgi:hypothetical protein
MAAEKEEEEKEEDKITKFTVMLFSLFPDYIIFHKYKYPF